LEIGNDALTKQLTRKCILLRKFKLHKEQKKSTYKYRTPENPQAEMIDKQVLKD